MKNPSYFDELAYPVQLSDLTTHLMPGADVISVLDAIEDSEGADDLIASFSALLPDFSVDRVTPSYIRFKFTPEYGISKYLRIEF